MTLFDKVFDEIQQLVNKFTDNLTHYMGPVYSEAEARQDFIDNFFIALGWDVHCKQQNKCNRTDRQTDKLVYELYGLTEEEISIVEGV